MDTASVTFITSDNVTGLFMASFDQSFNLIGSVYCPPANSPSSPPPLFGVGSNYVESDPLMVINGGYIMTIQYDGNIYQLISTFYVSDVNALPDRPFVCIPGGGLSTETNISDIMKNNLNAGLLDLSTLSSYNISLIVCGNINAYVADDTEMLTLPNGCNSGFIFGNNPNGPSICVSPDIVSGVASNWVADYSYPYQSTPYSGSVTGTPPFGSSTTGSSTTGSSNVGSKVKGFLNDVKSAVSNGKVPKKNSSSNTALILIIILIVVIAILIGVVFYQYSKRSSGYNN